MDTNFENRFEGSVSQSEPVRPRGLRGTGELLLYLDFDGVLHHANVLWHPKIGPYQCAGEGHTLMQHAELLEQLLAPYPEVRVVLSTAWAIRYGCADAAKRLPPALAARVIGATFHSRMPRAEFWDTPRGLQVWHDVVRRKPRAWLALDDVPDGWPEHTLKNYVKTPFDVGLSDPAVLIEFKLKLQEMCQ